MNHYIKISQNIVKDKNTEFTIFNSKNPHIPYNKYLPAQYIFNPQNFIESINFNIGKNVVTKPYTYNNKPL
jgi:hypothetical protein